MHKHSRRLAWLAFASLSIALPAAAQLKIAFIDPLSGGAASAGIAAQKHLTYLIDRANAAGGFNGEARVAFLRQQGRPQESLIALKKALDDGAPLCVQE